MEDRVHRSDHCEGLPFERMPIEAESPEEMPGGYGVIRNNLCESSLSDRTWGDLQAMGITIPPSLVFQYTDHRGLRELRESIAMASCNPDSKDILGPDDVMVFGGAAAALYTIHTAVLGSASKLLVVRPNYSTNLETPRTIGANIDYYDLQHDNNFVLNVDEFCSRIQPDTTLVSITTPHNPTGMIIPNHAIETIYNHMTKVAPKCRLLVDETYRGMSLDESIDDSTVAAAWPLGPDGGKRMITVSSMSKTYGLPGVRIGWCICRDADFMNTLLAAKEQMSISGSVIDEYLASQILSRHSTLIPQIKQEVKERRSILISWLEANKDIIECVTPHGGVVCFPKIKASIDTSIFYKRLFEEYGTIVGPGHWFYQPDTSFRLGFGWPTREQLVEGLECISKLIREMMR